MQELAPPLCDKRPASLAPSRLREYLPVSHCAKALAAQ